MGDIIKRSGGYTLRWYEGGRRRVMASRQATHADARRMLQAIEGRVARGLAGIEERVQQPRLSVAELCQRYLNEYAHPKIKDLPKYRRSSRYSLKPVLALIGHRMAEQLVRADIERVRNTLAQNYKPNTVRAAMRPLATAFSWAVTQGILRQSPAAGLTLPDKDQRIEYLTHEEAKALLAEAERQARGGGGERAFSLWIAVALGLYAGLRRGEILGLRWQDVDLDARRLNVARSYAALPKSGKPRQMPLAAPLVPLLKEWRPRCPRAEDNLVCPLLRRGVWRLSSGTFGEIAELYPAAGVRTPAAPWHALRHTFASHFLMAGGSLPALQRLLGHADIKTTQVYAHLSSDFLGEQLDRLKF